MRCPLVDSVATDAGRRTSPAGQATAVRDRWVGGGSLSGGRGVMPGMNGGRGVLPSAAPTRAADGTDGIRLTDEQQQVVGNRSARLRVLAGPGTGKTTTIVEAVAERIESGVCAA